MKMACSSKAVHGSMQNRSKYSSKRVKLLFDLLRYMGFARLLIIAAAIGFSRTGGKPARLSGQSGAKPSWFCFGGDA